MKKARVVPKAEYAGYVAKQAGLAGWGTLLLCLGGAGAMLAGAATLLLLLLLCLGGDFDPDRMYSLLAIGTATTAICAFAAHRGAGIVLKAKRAAPVLPLTRSTAATLPAASTLLRAGDAPQQVQDTLLRAASGTEEDHGEELLRATYSVGEEG